MVREDDLGRRAQCWLRHDVGAIRCRLVDGVEAMARMLHPTLVHTRIADGLVRKITLSNGQRCRQSALASCFAAYT